MATFCYIPQKGVDDVIAGEINKISDVKWSPFRVATLRGMYDENNANSPLNLENPSEVAQVLINYRAELARQSISKVNDIFQRGKNVSSNLAKVYKQLKKAFTSKERYNRVSMISTMFSDTVDAIQRVYPALSRTAICRGTIVDGKMVGGQSQIFSRVYDSLLDQMEILTESNEVDKANKIKAVLDNWSALAAHARMRLRDTESLTLNSKLKYVAETTPGNFSAELDSFDIEESKREAWQEESDKQSAFGSISKEVRRLLGSIQDRDGEEGIKDDLGFPIMLDPVKAHQTLSDLLIGVTSEKQMMAVLAKNSSSIGWLNSLIKTLKHNNRLKTQMFVDFHKGYQPYSIMARDSKKSKNGIAHFITKILNRESENSLSQYHTRVSVGNVLSPNSVFNSDGTVNWDNLQSLSKKINSYFNAVDTSSNIFKDKYWTSDKDTRARMLKEMFDALGIPVDNNIINQLTGQGDYKNVSNASRMASNRDVKKIIEALFNISVNGIEKLSSEYGKKIPFSKFIKIERSGSDYKIEKDIKKILNILEKKGKRLRYERRARYKDAKGKTTSFDSYVTPSYMSDVFGAISSFVKNEDKKGLQKYIEEKFLSSSYFYRGKQGEPINPDLILNQWIKELYTSSMDDTGFANNFTFERFLGEDDGLVFENFTSKQHLISVMQMYFSDAQISSKSEYAHYPVFILGDSGVAKFIKAKRYKKEDILEGMYKVYLQEIQRLKIADALNAKLKSKGYKTVDNFSTSKEFSILTFLNEEKYAKMIDPNRIEASVKEAISSYMQDAVERFKKQADHLKVLETKKVKINGHEVERYVNLNQNVPSGSEAELDLVLEDFYWNSTFAMINQLQFFTIDPSFYKGTKDLQKRYKEIHAPGTVLSLQALDFNGNPYSTDGIERAIYFEDIELPAAKDFIKALRDRGISEDIIKKYLNNTLTDGQGYRTLESYRKVRGMAGQWTEEHEAAYNEIKSIRAHYGTSNIPSEALSRIAELAVTFQPIKPYLFTHERYKINETEVALIPVQHKYSEAVIIPELLPDGLLKDMALYMEENSIDVVGSTTTVKVGNFGAATIDYKINDDNLYVDSNGDVIPVVDENGKPLLDKEGKELKLTAANQKKNPNFRSLAVPVDADSFKRQMDKGYPHHLRYEDYRIQTNVPEHLNASQLFGTQLRKLIMAGILMNDSKYSSYVGGKKVNLGGRKGESHMVTLNGRNLISFYNSLIISNILESFDTFKSQVTNIETLSDILLQNVISNSRESTDNILAYTLEDGTFNIPLFEGELEHDASATLFSIFKKIVNKQRIKGGSAVQVSALGIQGYEQDGGLKYVVDPSNPSNILYAECEIPFDLSYTVNGKEIALKFEDWCNADGTLILGDEILDENHPEYRKYLSYTDDKGKVRKPKIEDSYPGILSRVAYRIPTERDYSMINLQVKRFSQKTSGGTIRVPVQGTTISGFDFDIDKLYFMMREYKFKENRSYTALSEETKRSIWNRIYEKYPNIEHELREYRDKHGSENKSLNSYWDYVINSYDKNELFAEAAKELGIEIGEFTTEYTPTYIYDTDNSPLANSKEARNNMLIDLIQQRLMDEETFSQRYTPGGFVGASKAARVMRELLFTDPTKFVDPSTKTVNFDKLYELAKDKDSDPEPNYNPTDIMTLITYNQQNQVAGKLIGVFANQNTNHAFASLMKSFTLKSPISFCGHSYNDLLTPPNGVDVDLNVAEFLAASVDAVKDPVLNFLNFNTLTADAGALLARIGYTTEEIGLLFNQPIIRDICEYAFNNGTSLEIATTTVLSEYEKLAGDAVAGDNDLILSKNELARNIINDRVQREKGLEAKKNKTFAANQIEIAKLFESISAASSDVSRFVTSSKFTASNAVGSTFGDMYAQQMRVKKYLEDADNNSLAFQVQVTEKINRTINNDTESLSLSNEDYLFGIMDNPFGYEQAMYDMNRRVKDILSAYFPYDTDAYAASRELLADVTKSGTLDADTINSMHRDLLAYMLSQVEGGWFNGERSLTVNGETMSTRDYYINKFPKRLYEAISKNPELKSFSILSDDIAEFITDEETGTISLQVHNVGSLQAQQRDAVKESWEELAEDYPYIAKDLFIYNFYKTGFNFGPFSFMSLAPNSIKQSIIVDTIVEGNTTREISYIDFLKMVQNSEIGINIEDFIKQYIANHTDNERLVFNPKGKVLSDVRKLYKINNIIQKDFEIDASVGDNRRIWTIGRAEDGSVKFRPFVKIDGVLYRASGDGGHFYTSTSNKMTYEKVTVQGITNKSLMFTYSTKSTQSPIILEDSYFEGSTSIEPEVSREGTFDRQAAIMNIAREFKAASDASGARDEVGELLSLGDFIESLSNDTDETLKSKIEIIRKACRKNGILVLDENGNLMENC